jgi:putative protein-disulfide isomerase
MNKIAEAYKTQLEIEVLSGNMIPEEEAKPIAVMAPYIQKAYKHVEERSGIQFGEDFLWHIFNPEKSDWIPSSLLPAIALSVFKSYYPDQAVSIASDIQYALNFEGRDLTDKEAYRHLLEKYLIPAETFYEQLAGEAHKENALYEFALVKQLRVTGFPTVLLQASDSKFYLLAQGYTDYETLKERIEKVFAELKTQEK